MRVLTVCTGNICRSPAAELLLARELGDEVEVSSAGTRALDGIGVPDLMLAELASAGIDGSAHRGRTMSEAILREQDLIIGMTRAHRSGAAQMAPPVIRRVVTLAELAAVAQLGVELEGDTVAERVGSVAGAVAANRHLLVGEPLEDVPDPYGGSEADYRESFAIIRDATAIIGAWIRG